MSIPYDCVIPDRPNWLMRLLGARWPERYKGKITGYRMNWGELSFSAPRITAEFYQFEEGYSLVLGLLFFTAYIKTPFRGPDRGFGEGHVYEFDIRFGELSGVTFQWANRRASFEWPWAWSHVRTDILTAEGWKKDNRFPRLGEPQTEEPVVPAVEVHDYRYVLRSGEVQHRKATIHVEEREWRWRWLKWLPWPRKVVRSISVNFDGGSWRAVRLMERRLHRMRLRYAPRRRCGLYASPHGA